MISGTLPGANVRRRSAYGPTGLVAALLSLASSGATAAPDHPPPTAAGAEALGRVHFPISCSLAAQQGFNRALAMLHSFWFPQATVAFTAVAQTDPDCAMAHWGTAMSLRGNPLVGAPGPAALKAGAQAIEKAKALGGGTQRERDYLAAM